MELLELRNKARLHVSNIKKIKKDCIETGKYFNQIRNNCKSELEFEKVVKNFNLKEVRQYILWYQYHEEVSDIADPFNAFDVIMQMYNKDKKREQMSLTRMVNKFEKTGKRPEGWTREAEREYDRRKVLALVKLTSKGAKK